MPRATCKAGVFLTFFFCCLLPDQHFVAAPCSLDIHTDSVSTRRIAFVFHLTKHWEPTYGGLFMAFSNKSHTDIINVNVPEFNSLAFFDVSEERFVIPHVVTEVANGINKPRISITGWFAYTTDNDELEYGPGIANWPTL